IDLNQTIKEVLSDVEVSIKESRGEIEINKLPLVRGDALQLHQVFQNLICNSLKFSQKNQVPRINIESKKPKKDFVQVTLTDNGIGIEEEYFEKIFQPFQRLHGREEYDGSGMGLTLCKKIVERHGGKISVKSQLGKGTTFIVELPLAGKGGEFEYDPNYSEA
ncbi:MAG: ATP-binding protein, partial [bacterium]|nr:ATP-binding protein [bacterium]